MQWLCYKPNAPYLQDTEPCCDTKALSTTAATTSGAASSLGTCTQ